MVPELFEKLGYALGGPPQIESRRTVGRALEAETGDRDTVIKAVYVSNGWTHILDPELVLSSLGAKEWLRLSGELYSRVVCWICEGTSGSYGFSLYDGGALLRDVMAVDGIVEEKGAPRPEEEGVDWEEAFEDDVMNVVANLGAQYHGLAEEVPYYVFVLRFEG